ncbi:MAG TPA: hypothetical protein VF458_20370 [Ktedonobacteraceae bacterium]
MMVFPGTQDRLKHTIQVLQQLQRLLTVSATLSDVADVLACVEAEFGSEVLLEDVIQRLVGEHLAVQIAQRGPVRRSNQVELEVAA